MPFAIFSKKVRTYLEPAFSALRILRQLVRQFVVFFERLMAATPVTSTIYYMFFSTAMQREHWAVLSGRVRYQQDHAIATQGSSYFLRRNIHRLEKGLIMRPRRAVFARDYIYATVETYKSLISRGGQEPSTELKWAHDVFTTYFHVVGKDPAVDRARRIFFELASLGESCTSRPYRRDLSKRPVNFDDFMALSMQRRSVRWFLQVAVPRDLVDNAITAAAQAPSACNRQPFHYRIFDEPKLVREIASTPLGTKGFHHNFPMIVVVVGHLRAYFDERDRHIIYIDSALATMAFLYALEAQGLSSCIINWPDIYAQEKEMRELLTLAPDERPIMLVAVGWPDPEGMVPYSAKKALHEIRSYNVI